MTTTTEAEQFEQVYVTLKYAALITFRTGFSVIDLLH